MGVCESLCDPDGTEFYDDSDLMYEGEHWVVNEDFTTGDDPPLAFKRGERYCITNCRPPFDRVELTRTAHVSEKYFAQLGCEDFVEKVKTKLEKRTKRVPERPTKRRKLKDRHYGEKIDLNEVNALLERNGSEFVEVKLRTDPNLALGLTINTETAEVTCVREGGLAAQAGVQVGWQLRKYAGKFVKELKNDTIQKQRELEYKCHNDYITLKFITHTADNEDFSEVEEQDDGDKEGQDDDGDKEGAEQEDDGGKGGAEQEDSAASTTQITHDHAVEAQNARKGPPDDIHVDRESDVADINTSTDQG